jgi:hypothetical protein
MRAVYYSLVLTASADAYQTQWIRSIGSLRRFNRGIPVYLFVFNEPTKTILEKADEYDVIVHRMGSYRDCLVELAGEEGAALSSIPTLNKLLPLEHFGEGFSQVLFLDCDTYFFGDVGGLFEKYQHCRLYAREAPNSRRSVFLGYDPAQIDEDLLSRIAADTGGAAIPPYNTGVVLLNHGLSTDLNVLKADFIQYAWRLILGASAASRVALPPGWKDGVSKAGTGRLGEGIEFPSVNYWIVDEVALSLTLGRIPGLSHDQFSMADVLQNGEFMIYPSYRTKCTLVHYFRGNEVLFLRHTPVNGD